MRQVWAETRKLLHAPGALVSCGLLVLFAAFVVWQTHKNIEAGFWDRSLLDPATSFTYVGAALSTLGPLLTAIIGAISMGQEYGCRTWPFLLTQGATRERVWLVKVLSLLVIVVGSLVACLLVGWAGSVWATGRFVLPHLDAQVVSQLAAVLFSLCFWAFFAFVGALIFRGTAAGLATGIGFPFTEMLFQGIPGLRAALPVWNQRALAVAVFGSEERGMTHFAPHPAYPPAGEAVLVLAALLVALLAGSYLFMRRSSL